MNVPLLIMNVQVFSAKMNAYYLISNEAILRYEKHTIIKIPMCTAKSVNGGPVVGERYYVRYRDGIGEDFYPPEFRYVGTMNEQLVFQA